MDTQRYIAQTSGATLVIVEDDQARVCALDVRPNWAVGRYDPNMANTPDILFTSPIVSREHGWIQNIDDQWIYVDNPKNLNGTFHNGVKISRPRPGTKKPTILESGDVLRIDNDDLDHVSSQGVFMLFTTTPVKGNWTTYPLKKQTTFIGRDSSCDIVESLPYVSAKHAKITNVNNQYYLSDCGSSAGTFLNGKQVTVTTPLREKDYISICDCSFIFLGNKLLYAHRNRKREKEELRRTAPDQRPVVLKADIKTKRVKDNSGNGMKELIRDIRLEIRQGTLVALLGTAGAGKSTVMNCLNGMDLEGVQGSVIFRDVDLMKHFEQMKYLIGSVPQKKTFHPDFSPEKELRIAAQKRLPADTTRKEINERVDKTLEMLGISGVRKSKNSKLSGGEQTRVNIGIELVADRELLCLDEPDQGLDPKYKHEVFQIMRDLAHKNGKSVLSIIHDVSEIDMFDQVIMLVKADGVGQLAFSGTPEEMRKKFGVTDIRTVYGLLEKEPHKYIVR